MVSLFGVGQRDYFCKYCGNAVCENCSRNKKYLSKDATERLRVCDLCDCKLDNMRIKLGHDRIILLQEQKAKLQEQLIQMLKDQKE
jgi:hypothetical protein